MVIMVYSSIGIIVGEKVNPETLTLKNPRLLQIGEQKAGGPVPFGMFKLFGDPKGIEFGKDIISNDVTDENVLKAYAESVTGLSLVKKPSLVDAGGNALQ